MRARGIPIEGNETELNDIDVALTKILLKAEVALKPQLRKNRRGNFTKALDGALWPLAYWQKRVISLTTDIPH